eukprot:365596-Chlamydomonas_euryale.AAC.39
MHANALLCESRAIRVVHACMRRTIGDTHPVCGVNLHEVGAVDWVRLSDKEDAKERRHRYGRDLHGVHTASLLAASSPDSTKAVNRCADSSYPRPPARRRFLTLGAAAWEPPGEAAAST